MPRDEAGPPAATGAAGGPGKDGRVVRSAGQLPPVIATVAGAFDDSTLPFDPMVVITPMQMVTMSANMIAYSTAVGPSSRFRKFTTA